MNMPAAAILALCAALLLLAPPSAALAQGTSSPIASGRGAVRATGTTTSARAAPAPLTTTQRAGIVHQHAVALTRRLASQLDEARRDRDRFRARCLSDILSQANALVRIIEQQLVSLRLAEDLHDASRQNHAVTVLRVQETRIGELDGNARICLGDTGPMTAGTRVIVIIDPSVPREDPTQRPAEGREFPWVPPPSTP